VIGASFSSVLTAAASGDQGAYAALWRDVQPGLLRYLHVMAPGSAEDVASETWVDVVRGLARFRGDERAFRSWAFTIARHRAADWRRRVARRPANPLPLERLPEHAAPDDPVAAAFEAASTEAALALIAELPREQAEVVALRVVADLDVAEVAAIVGKRPGAVRVLAHRGLRRLARRLGAQRRAVRAPSSNRF
jgi:RNA polymerase sigma-70 factor (ECF subfamily)